MSISINVSGVERLHETILACLSSLGIEEYVDAGTVDTWGGVGSGCLSDGVEVDPTRSDRSDRVEVDPTYDMGFADLAALMEFHANNPTAANKPVAVMMVYKSVLRSGWRMAQLANDAGES